jgi:hypothetical protein
MMLSYTHRFIFVHIYRTGGTSIFRALGKRFDVVEALHNTPVTEVAARLKSLGLNPEIINLHFHASAREIRATVGEAVFAKYFKFAFVRNPFEHVLSLYLYTLKHPQQVDHAAMSRHADFKAYVFNELPDEPRIPGPQSNLIADEDGKLLVDFVGRYENIEADFAKVCDRIGARDVSLVRSNVTEHGPWQSYYDRTTFERVRTRYQHDIAAFGYGDRAEDYGIS